jgi:hypothetical protein
VRPHAIGAAPPASGATPLYGPLQQLPFSQWPPQHWLSAVHAPGPPPRHPSHTPFALQKSLPQHLRCASQAHPVDAQHVWSAAHAVLQQLSQAVLFGAPKPGSMHERSLHWPSWQVRPSQHSSSDVQAASLFVQPHWPCKQCSRAQQSPSDEQVPPWGWQWEHCLFWQVPTQQSPSAAHVAPELAQGRHLPPTHAR